MLTIFVVVIQIYQPGKQTSETILVEDTQEAFVESEMEEPDSEDEKPPFNPETEKYEMTENPMLRHRHTEENQVD